MASLNAINKFLNKDLKKSKIKDGSRNGLQVKGRAEVKKIGFAVDACLETFKKAKKQKCDMVIVHHGLYWKKVKDKVGVIKKRAAYLKKNKISLYAAHLPLDLHPKYGNNVELCGLLGLKNLKKFGNYHGAIIGYYGNTNTTISSLVKKVQNKLKTKTINHLFGKKRIRKVGVITGGAASMVEDCKKYNLDAYVTGEPSHVFYHYNKEIGINVIFAGHYTTETLGVKALSKVLKEKFNIQTVFLHSPTGL